MDVPIDDEYPVTLGGKCRRTDGDIVQETEPHCAVCFGVVSWWSHRNKGDAFTSTLQGSDCLETGAGGSTGRGEASPIGRTYQGRGHLPP